MIFTHCGKMGDMFQCLPILSWWYKKTGEKPTLVLAKFPFAKESEELLRLQDCIKDVVYINYTPVHFGLGGQPYRFDINQYLNTTEEVTHLGFRSFPDRFFGDFVAEEYNLGYDYNYVLNLGDISYKYRGKTVVMDRYEDDFLKKKGVKGEYFNKNNSLLKNLRFGMGASNVKTTNTATAILMLMAGKNIVVYSEDKNVNAGNFRYIHMELVYSKLKGKATWVNI